MRRRLANALRISLAGLGAACRHEEAFRLELLLALVLAPLALWLGENGLERALLLSVLLLVLIMELLNSAVEAIVDRIGPDTLTCPPAPRIWAQPPCFVP